MTTQANFLRAHPINATPTSPSQVSRFKIAVLCLLAGSLVACATLPDPALVRATVTRELAIPETDIVFQAPASYGFAVGNSNNALFQEGLYVQTRAAIALFRLTGDHVERDVVLPFNRIQEASLATVGTLSHEYQLQFITNPGVLAVFIKTTSALSRSTLAESEAAFSSLHHTSIPVLSETTNFIYPLRPYNNSWDDYPYPYPYYGYPMWGSGVFFNFSR